MTTPHAFDDDCATCRIRDHWETRDEHEENAE